MSIKAIDSNKLTPSWYTPESERGEENPTRFKLRPLTPPEKESVTVFENGELSIPPRNFSQLLRMGVVDWEHFEDEKGNELECIPSNHSRITSDLRFELATEIIIRSELSGSERKN